MAKSAIRIEAERLCEKYPDATSLSLAKRLAKEFKETTSVELARNHIRTIRGNRGKAVRHQATAPRPNQPAGVVYEMPRSVAKGWEPFILRGKRRVGIISDLHVPYHSDIAVDAAIGHLSAMDIDTLIINGDLADWYGVSRWEQNPHNRIGMKAEMEAVRATLRFIRQRLPSAHIIYKAGNHEERWNKYIWAKAPEIWDLPSLEMPQLLQLDSMGIEWVEDQRIIMLGELPILHGHELPKGISSPVNAARGAYMRTKHTVLVGHSHQTSGHCEPDLFHSECFVWSCGCLCDLTPEYARINRWNWGFSTVDVAEDGSFNVSNLRISKHGEVRGG